MLNLLIADDDIYYAKFLMEQINKQNNSVRVINIAVDGEETLNILNTMDEIDIFLLDLKMPKLNGIEILKRLSNIKKRKYKKSCIVISGEADLVMQLEKNNPIIYDVLFKSQYNQVIYTINEIISEKQIEHSEIRLKRKIINELKYLGYNISHNGTKYIMDIIYYIITENNGEINNLKRNIYPKIAIKNNVNPHNVKHCVRRATEYMYYECEENKFKSYFYLQDEKKPNTKMIISTIVSKIIL